MQTTSFFVRFYSLKDFVDLQQSNIMFYRHTEDFSPKYPFVPMERTTPQVLLDSSLTLRMTLYHFSNTFLYLSVALKKYLDLWIFLFNKAHEKLIIMTIINSNIFKKK